MSTPRSLFALVLLGTAAALTLPALGEPPPSQSAAPDLRCSFCDRSNREVKKLINHRDHFICEGCVALSTEILLAPFVDEAVGNRNQPDDKLLRAYLTGWMLGAGGALELPLPAVDAEPAEVAARERGFQEGRGEISGVVARERARLDAARKGRKRSR